MASKKDSFAKLQIMASCHKDAVPCVMKNEGKKLYQKFEAMFSMTNLHQASLPTVRAEFYAIAQRENESILKYTSRVDVIVATMAKLGERISTGAWIYALGNGLRPEFTECKKGILHSQDGFGTVLKVKTRLQSEEAVIASQNKKAPLVHQSPTDDEIALVAKKTKDAKKSHTIKTQSVTPPASTTTTDEMASSSTPDTALWLKGKGGKGKPSKGKNRWTTPAQPWGDTWTQWTSPPKGKGQGKGNANTEQLWCDICQRPGHSTDWCYDNPQRTGGKPLYDDLWCDTCNRSGHTSSSCFATSIKIIPKGKGKTKGKPGKPGNRAWKSQNFPANYHSEQATPALHDETSSSIAQGWWEEGELGSVIMDHDPNPVPLLAPLLEDYVNHNNFDDDDDAYISDYIDLVLFAIITNIERMNAYQLQPSNALMYEIHEHSASITRAENCLNVHIRRIIRQFKTTIKYDETMSQIIDIATDITNDVEITVDIPTKVKSTKEVTVTHEIDSAIAVAFKIEVEIANDVEIAQEVEIANEVESTNEVEIQS